MLDESAPDKLKNTNGKSTNHRIELEIKLGGEKLIEDGIAGWLSEALIRSGRHFRRANIRTAAQAAPNPLSILTTVTPEAQLLSIASRAVMPFSDAP